LEQKIDITAALWEMLHAEIRASANTSRCVQFLKPNIQCHHVQLYLLKGTKCAD